MGEQPPICSDISTLKKLVTKALTKNQILLLCEIEKNSTKTITTLVNKLSKNSKIPLSTLKLNGRLLKELDLIEYENFDAVKLTGNGSLVLSIIKGRLE